MLFTSIQSFRTFYTIIHLNKKIYKRNYHKEGLWLYALTGQNVGNGEGNRGSNGGYQYVKSGGFSTNSLDEAIQAMAERGIKGSVNLDSLSGLCYIQTDVLPNTELDNSWSRP